jgi:hypothetical protein
MPRLIGVDAAKKFDRILTTEREKDENEKAP